MNPANDAGRLVQHVLAPLKETFVGKDEIIDLMGICLVAGENLFLLGPPGTAKSALVRELGGRLEGTTFEYLLTRFTEPSELFGPFDIRKLRDGELTTNTEGMLPEAELVFLDELLNANSAILNSILTVLNERVLRRGREVHRLPTRMVVGASNRLPEDDALGALFDRFLLRVTCDNVEESRLQEVLEAGWKLDLRPVTTDAAMSMEDVRTLHERLPEVDLSPVRTSLVELISRIRRAGIPISDRRGVKLQRLVAASAILCGREQARVSDLWVFRHIWDTVEQQEILAGLVEESLKQGESADGDHPRSLGREAPDPESLAHDLDCIAGRLSEDDLTSADRAVLRDRLGVLSARSQWVADESLRVQIEERIEGLWSRFD